MRLPAIPDRLLLCRDITDSPNCLSPRPSPFRDVKGTRGPEVSPVAILIATGLFRTGAMWQ